MSKSLAKNALFNLFYKGLSIVFPLITVTYASHKLLAYGIGQVSYAQSVISYFVVFASLGIPYYGIREVAKSNSSNSLNKLFTNLFIINAIFTTISTIAYYLLIFLNSEFQSEKLLFIIIGFYLLLNYFNVDWFYQGKEEYVYIAIRSLIVKILFTILVFIMINNPQDYVKYGLLYSLSIAGNNLFNFVHLRKYVKFDFSEIEILKHIKPVLIFFAGVISIEMYMQIGVTLLGYYYHKEYVGYYTNSNHVMRVVANALMAIGTVILPRATKYMAEKRIEETKNIATKLFCLLWFISMPCAVGMAFLSKYIVPVLFGNSFVDAIITLKILSVLIIVLPVVGGLSTPLLFSTNQEKKYLNSSIASVLFNILLIIFLMPFYYHNGVACASVATESFMMVVQLYFLRELFDFAYIIRYIKTIIIMCLLMAIAMIVVDSLTKSYVYIAICSEIIVGACVYTVLAYIYKDYSFQYILNKFTKVFNR